MVTLDSHSCGHIAFAQFWNSQADGHGHPPAPFTIITYQDLVDGKWFPSDASLQVS